MGSGTMNLAEEIAQLDMMGLAQPVAPANFDVYSTTVMVTQAADRITIASNYDPARDNPYNLKPDLNTTVGIAMVYAQQHPDKAIVVSHLDEEAQVKLMPGRGDGRTIGARQLQTQEPEQKATSAGDAAREAWQRLSAAGVTSSEGTTPGAAPRTGGKLGLGS